MGSQAQVCLRWNAHKEDISKAIAHFLLRESLCDVTLFADGQSIRAHRLVLSACSAYFANIFAELPSSQPAVVFFRDVKLQELQAVLEYMYKGSVDIPRDSLGAFLKTAESLEIRNLGEGEQSSKNDFTGENSTTESSTDEHLNNLKCSTDLRVQAITSEGNTETQLRSAGLKESVGQPKGQQHLPAAVKCEGVSSSCYEAVPAPDIMHHMLNVYGQFPSSQQENQVLVNNQEDPGTFEHVGRVPAATSTCFDFSRRKKNILEAAGSVAEMVPSPRRLLQPGRRKSLDQTTVTQPPIHSMPRRHTTDVTSVSTLEAIKNEFSKCQDVATFEHLKRLYTDTSPADFEQLEEVKKRCQPGDVFSPTATVRSSSTKQVNEGSFPDRSNSHSDSQICADEEGSQDENIPEPLVILDEEDDEEDAGEESADPASEYSCNSINFTESLHTSPNFDGFLDVLRNNEQNRHVGDGDEVVYLSPTVSMKKELLMTCNHSSVSKLVSDLLMSLVSREVLAVSSLTGKTCHGVRERKNVLKLDEDVVNAVIEYVHKVTGASIRDIKDAIRTKLNNEGKRLTKKPNY